MCDVQSISLLLRMQDSTPAGARSGMLYMPGRSVLRAIFSAAGVRLPGMQNMSDMRSMSVPLQMSGGGILFARAVG